MEINGFCPETTDLEALLRRCDHDADRALCFDEFNELFYIEEEDNDHTFKTPEKGKPVENNFMEQNSSKILEMDDDGNVIPALTSDDSGLIIGILCLDYNYPQDLPDPTAFGQNIKKVHYQPVKGLTFDMCLSGKLTPEVE